MSNTNESFARSVALDRALGWAENNNIGADKILEVAEKFRAFLTEESKTGPKTSFVEDGRPVFELPRQWDGYVYFQFSDTSILYRARTSVGSSTAGGVDRISLRHERKWRLVQGKDLDTRSKLRAADKYNEIPASRARTLVQNCVEGVRFE